MSGDYLDLLLMRETRTAPLAEPRIDPVPAPAVLGPASAWDDIVEERETPYFPPPAADRWRPDVEHRRVEADPEAHVTAAAFPPSIARPVDQPSVAEPRSMPAPMPARIAADDAKQERPAAPRPIHTREIISEPVETAAVRAAPEAGAGHAGPRPPQPQPHPPEAPRVIATRPAPVGPDPSAEPAIPQPVTIRIDRVEVRAAPAARPPAQASPRSRPRVSLDEFLKRRSGARHE